MRRYIISGAPGAGKTTILAALRTLGYSVVDEAATDLITGLLGAGRDEPWRDPGFIDAIVTLQCERERCPVAPNTTIQLFDRSPICTLALAYHLGLPVTPALAAEVDRIVAEHVYQPRIFFVRLLGFITPTPVRRITLAQSMRFEKIHERVYRDLGFELIDVPADAPERRAQLVDRYLRSW